MITLGKAQIVRLHDKLITETGGADGIRDEGLLESALESAFHTFDGEELYPSIAAKVARITYGLMNNHAFVDGNKRIGTYVMLVLLEVNHIETDFTDDEIVKIGFDLANGTMSWEQLMDVIIAHM
jgi:death-on-curing protein